MQTSDSAAGTRAWAFDRLGGVVAWREAGTSEAPVAIFLHGLGGNRSAWQPQLQGLADLRRCVAWDLPGYGDSPGLPGSLPELAALAAAWITELTTGAEGTGAEGVVAQADAAMARGAVTGGVGRAGEPVDVVGLSFGGMVAQHLALDHPHLVRTLTLLDTSPAFGLDGVTTRDEWLATRVEPMRDTATTPERAAAVVAGLVGPGCPQRVREDAIAAMQAVPPAALAASCRALVDHDTRDRLHLITTPTLVMVGEADTETPPSYAAAIAERIPGARLVVVPGAGHLLNVEDGARVNAELRRHWQAEPKRPPGPRPAIGTGQAARNRSEDRS